MKFNNTSQDVCNYFQEKTKTYCNHCNIIAYNEPGHFVFIFKEYIHGLIIQSTEEPLCNKKERGLLAQLQYTVHNVYKILIFFVSSCITSIITESETVQNISYIRASNLFLFLISYSWRIMSAENYYVLLAICYKVRIK
jgi:hypothetical protein